MTETPTPEAIRLEHIVKRFGAVTALRDVSLYLKQGEVLGLVGDNGAGKSTLIKIITGYIQPDGGRIFVNGQEVRLRSVTQARSLGIETVYQDLALVNELTIYHNIFLKREHVLGFFPLLNNREMKAQAEEYLRSMGVNIPSIDATVAKLSGGQRQSIAIARAVYSNAKILLLDEPLAAMGAKEGSLIMDLIRRLKQRGDVSIIMIAHNYAQVLEICDRVNLLQHGSIVLDKPASPELMDELTELVMREYRIGATGS